MRPLGKVQKQVLHTLEIFGSYPAGWVWRSPSGTVRILESLVKRGLVVKTKKIGRRGRFMEYTLKEEARS